MEEREEEEEYLHLHKEDYSSYKKKQSDLDFENDQSDE